MSIDPLPAPQSLRKFLSELPPAEVLHVGETTELDYRKTALALELDARRQSPVIIFDQPSHGGAPVVTNLFADRDRIARMVGTSRKDFNTAWRRAEENRIEARVVAAGPVQERIGIDHALAADRVHVGWLTDLFIRHESNRDQLIVAEW